MESNIDGRAMGSMDKSELRSLARRAYLDKVSRWRLYTAVDDLKAGGGDGEWVALYGSESPLIFYIPKYICLGACLLYIAALVAVVVVVVVVILVVVVGGDGVFAAAFVAFTTYWYRCCCRRQHGRFCFGVGGGVGAGADTVHVQLFAVVRVVFLLSRLSLYCHRR